MKAVSRKVLAAAALTAAFGSAPAFAYTINAGAIDVGSEDWVRGFTTSLHDSDEATETEWVNSVLGTNFSGTTNSPQTLVTKVDGEDAMYAFALPAPAPGYFLVKNATTWLLLENLDDFDWGVFSATGTFGDATYSLKNGNGDVTDLPKISHYAKFGGTTSVPEPGTLMLLGLGLLGLSLSRRSRAARAAA